MKLSQLDDQSLFCALIVGEAEGEPFIGKLAVACVVRNRVKDSRWPDSYEKVILQPKQFSCFNQVPREDDIPETYMKRYFFHNFELIWWRECWASANIVRNEYVSDITHGATNYYADYMEEPPSWAKGKTPCFEFGKHLFFRL